ncbi:MULTISPECIES: FxSxx-COOH system tetratricopeptide repeat protein, partial [unclassified Frankia]|uniref:FxSxx-COOH system tetratricopeptide repeat protein n=1 Tax=unclassified Frankia TaxID=2632575 RepID=UPI002AD4650C
MGVADSGGTGGFEWDFFVSYTQADRGWAEWVAWELEAAGFRVLVQAWHMVAGMSWSERMAAGMARSARTVAVLSPTYVASEACAAEWQAAWRSDLVGARRRLLPVRVVDFVPPAPLDGIVRTDLFGVAAEVAAGRLAAAVDAVRRGEARPTTAPAFPGRTADEGPRFPGVAPEVWSVGWPRNRLFTGRDVELSRVRERLAGGGVTVALPVAVHGLGGVGKTQLAVEYAYRHARDYDLVWWVPAEDPGSMVAALAQLADRCGVAVAGTAEESARVVVGLLGQGRRYRRWLLVLDNATEPDDPFGVLAAAAVGGGHVLVTSRDGRWSRLAGTVEVDVLPRGDAVRLLRGHVSAVGDADAEQVTAAVGDLPLAVEQAGAFLAETGMAPGEYAGLLAEERQALWAAGAPKGVRPVAVTWTVTLHALDDPAVVMLARLWAHFGPEPIPVDLIRPDTAEVLPEPLDRVAAGRVGLAEAVGRLVRLALVRRVGDTVVMHRLVQEVLREDTPPEWRPGLRTAVCRLLAQGHPLVQDRPAAWPRYAQIQAHALTVGLVDDDDPDSRNMVFWLVWYLRERGDYPNSHILARDAYRCWSQILGEDHPDTLFAAGNLAATLRSPGDYAGARELLESVLA